MATHKQILVTGATGKQGGALISALLSLQLPSPFSIIALTRNPHSERAKALAEQPNLTILEGDLDDCKGIFKRLRGPLYGVFSVQVPLRPKVEQQQGKDLVDEAVAHGVKHFIYTSADRGGPSRSDIDGSPVPHFQSKFDIERHLKTVSSQHDMEWTIIRPVAFMDNLTPDFFGRAFATLWKINGVESKLQLVSTADIGKLAAEVFKSRKEYSGKAISFATDELTYQEANDTFKRCIGTDMPRTYTWIGHAVRYFLHEQLGIMFNWFKDVGFGADPNEFSGRVPGLQGFDVWLRSSSGFRNRKT